MSDTLEVAGTNLQFPCNEVRPPGCNRHAVARDLLIRNPTKAQKRVSLSQSSSLCLFYTCCSLITAAVPSQRLLAAICKVDGRSIRCVYVCVHVCVSLSLLRGTS